MTQDLRHGCSSMGCEVDAMASPLMCMGFGCASMSFRVLVNFDEVCIC